MTLDKKLPETELKIMLAVWEHQPPVSRAELAEDLRKYNWQDSVVLTMLSRLVKKGFLTQEKIAGRNYYTPQVTKKEYMDFESGNLLESVDGFYIQHLMSAFIKSEKLTDQDIRDIEKMIQDYKETRGKY